eukprot:m.173387 g.173387  ORF g.173387 m.173387 type:complete len:107 (-) comp14586_c0_seq1:1687-2007(-)
MRVSFFRSLRAKAIEIGWYHIASQRDNAAGSWRLHLIFKALDSNVANHESINPSRAYFDKLGRLFSSSCKGRGHQKQAKVDSLQPKANPEDVGSQVCRATRFMERN